MLTYAVEDFLCVLPELEPHFKNHYAAVGLHQDVIALDVDYDYYRALERSGVLLTITARDDAGVVQGYMLWLVKTHPRYQQSLTGTADVFWLAKPYRKGLNGLKMFRFAEQVLRTLGVQRVYAGTKRSLNVGALYRRLGYTHHEDLYVKLLTEG